MSLRLRLALFIALAIALALLVQGFLGYASFERLQMGNLERDLNAYLARIADQLEGRRRPPRLFWRERGGEPDTELVERLRSNTPLLSLPNPTPAGIVAHARLVQGQVVLREWGQFPSEIPMHHHPEARLEQNWLYKSVRLGPGLYLQGALEASQVRASLAGYRQTVLFTALLVALLGAGVAWLVSGPALRPLRHLQQAARRVADSGDLSLRVPAEGSGELLHLSQTFNQMLERLSAFRQRETEFTRNAAHELRTPLTSLRLQLDALQQGLASPEETLSVVREEVERMTHLSESLLTLAREGRGQRVGLDLAQLAREVAQKAGVPYQGPPHLETSGDPILLRQALENLLSNAQKYAPGAPVRLELSQEGDFAVLSVLDEGPGMPPEVLKRAAEPFYRAPGTRVPGNGLGLSVAAQVAQVHGGRLELKNLEPHGLKAELWIRVQPA
ncbi:sensor histidine kinase [Meiothermus taiwanensis]|uniref:histidine kinase n=2 Tax=Meiothermus taiwanensis TaxID=172827 RepID=A0A399DW42_9DEIN|nr:HAMP domain-containing sensor histidine kinase [Meiothermus taiwanensis]AWR85281.1 histidine kinase [Meiothermus taiwanensis WR-220]KIQ55758.1 histidine kinase [Meiothermus taiwanensis]KZK17046.1 histidine kinase [Meiothermus taiwanensis]RIH76286.1 Sensor protein QseC [Meiothermus taiwanensis]